MSSINVKISPCGQNVEVKAMGMAGPSCEQAVSPFSLALGSQVSHEQTPEYQEGFGQQQGQ